MFSLRLTFIIAHTLVATASILPTQSVLAQELIENSPSAETPSSSPEPTAEETVTKVEPTEAEMVDTVDSAPANDSSIEASEPVDNDFILMGEFVGEIEIDGKSETLAIQIRPIGNNRFEAISYYGGLPGQADHRTEWNTMIGQRFEDFLVLSGGPNAIFVETERCRLVNREGTQVGSLNRVRRESQTMGAAAPPEAMIVFDGTGIENLVHASMTDDGLLKQGADLKMLIQDFDMHLEFRLPFLPEAVDQARANSGVYIMSRYECQILDSFAQQIAFNGCGSIYRFRAPDLNMCLPPMVWQTYDLRFTAARWATDGTKLRDARLSTWLNGVLVQDDISLPDKTGHGQAEAVTLLPTKLQDHDNEVRFRNIWVVDRGIAGNVEFPVWTK